MRGPDEHFAAGVEPHRAPEIPPSFSLHAVPSLPHVEVPSFPPPPPLISSPGWKIQFITTHRQLLSLATKLSKLEAFPMDYETFGLPGEPLNQRLSWAMFGIPDGKKGAEHPSVGKAYLVDVLALEKESTEKFRGSAGSSRHALPPNPLEALREVLTNPHIKKIIQHSQFEVDQTTDYGIGLKGIIDIEKISRDLRPNLPSRKLGSLAAEFLGVTLDKEEQTSDWSKRPPDSKQLAYMPRDLQVPWEIYLTMKELKARAAPPTHASVSEVLSSLIEIQEQRLTLLRVPHSEFLTIGNAAGVFQTRLARSKEALKKLALLEYQRLEGRTAGIKTDFGRLALQCPRKLLMKRLSQFFTKEERQKILYEHLSKKSLENALRELKKEDKSIIISHVVNAVFEKAGFAKKPILLVSPNYERLYEGAKDASTLHAVSLEGAGAAGEISRRLPELHSAAFLHDHRTPPSIFLTLSGKPGSSVPPAVIRFDADPEAPEPDGQLTDLIQRIVKNPSIDLIGHGKRELSMCLAFFDASLPKNRAFTDTYALAKEVRGDLPTHSLEACAHELLRMPIQDLTPSLLAHRLPELGTLVKKMDTAAQTPYDIELLFGDEAPLEEERARKVQQVAETLLHLMAVDEASRLSLLREGRRGEKYDCLGRKFQKTKIQLHALIGEKRQAAIEENKCLIREQIARIRAEGIPLDELQQLLETRHTLKEKRFLLAGKDSEEKSLGEASLTPRRLSATHLEYLREFFPELAEALIETKINLKALYAIFKEQKLSKQGQAEVIKAIFKKDRKSPRAPAVRVRPRYGLMYEHPSAPH